MKILYENIKITPDQRTSMYWKFNTTGHGKEGEWVKLESMPVWEDEMEYQNSKWGRVWTTYVSVKDGQHYDMSTSELHNLIKMGARPLIIKGKFTLAWKGGSLSLKCLEIYK